jgi:hypothetical protein
MMTVKKMMPDYMKCVLIGALLGTISKYLDTVAVDGSWLADVFHYCSHILSRLGIWVLIAAMIAAYSKTIIRAALNTFVFFAGVLISYYLYSAYLFGFFPTKYFMLWGSIALLSPFLGSIVWLAKNHSRLAYILPALPMGLMLSLSLAIGAFYLDINYIDELIMYAVLCVIFYKEPKQMAVSIVFSFVLALLIEIISPYHF